jgi:hypothetical protein
MREKDEYENTLVEFEKVSRRVSLIAMSRTPAGL